MNPSIIVTSALVASSYGFTAQRPLGKSLHTKPLLQLQAQKKPESSLPDGNHQILCGAYPPVPTRQTIATLDETHKTLKEFLLQDNHYDTRKHRLSKAPTICMPIGASKIDETVAQKHNHHYEVLEFFFSDSELITKLYDKILDNDVKNTYIPSAYDRNRLKNLVRGKLDIFVNPDNVGKVFNLPESNALRNKTAEILKDEISDIFKEESFYRFIIAATLRHPLIRVPLAISRKINKHINKKKIFIEGQVLNSVDRFCC